MLTGRLRKQYSGFFMNDGTPFFPDITQFWHWDNNVFAYWDFEGRSFMLRSTMNNLYELESK